MVSRAQRPVLNAAILGRPVGHSLSPALHTAGYRALGLDDWHYAAHDLGADELADWVAARDDSWRGLSLTMPLKEAALAVAVSVSATAALTGAANTLVRREDLGWEAHNTDVHGVQEALAGAAHGGSATVLGAGATARSVLVALAALGVRTVRLAVRGTPRRETIELALRAGLATEVVPLAAWGANADRLVVSTLPPDGATAAVGGLGSGLREGTLMDVVYAGWPTPLATAATAVGLTVVSGLEMLVHQAAEQFRLFTGRPAPVDAMLAAGRAALGR